jgi:hypothetical protein
MLQLAATVTLDVRVEGLDVVVDATVKNVGPGHAIPTGEPLRQLILMVDAACAAIPLHANGGDALPAWAGTLDSQPSGADWATWPGASVGDVIRVVSDSGGWHDYIGYGPFGDGRFDAPAKGLPELLVMGSATIIAVNGDQVTLDRGLPPGDVAHRVSGGALPINGAGALPQAGRPGFAFARVLADAAGQQMVPHHAAVDVVSDNRLLPQQSWTSTHRFDADGCATPTAHAVLVHRALPLALACERGWPLQESVMVEVIR